MVTGLGTKDCCLDCGAKGSAVYNKCHAALAAKVGSVPACANNCIAANSPISNPAVGGDINAAIAAAFQPLFAALPSFGIHIALFFGALMFVIIGLWIVTRNPVDEKQVQKTRQVADAITKRLQA